MSLEKERKSVIRQMKSMWNNIYDFHDDKKKGWISLDEYHSGLHDNSFIIEWWNDLKNGKRGIHKGYDN